MNRKNLLYGVEHDLLVFVTVQFDILYSSRVIATYQAERLKAAEAESSK